MKSVLAALTLVTSQNWNCVALSVAISGQSIWASYCSCALLVMNFLHHTFIVCIMLQITFYRPGTGHFKTAGLVTSCSVAGEECVPALYMKRVCQLAITIAFNYTLQNFTVQRPTDELYCRAVTRLQLVIVGIETMWGGGAVV